MNQATKDARLKDANDAIARVNKMKPSSERAYVNDRIRRMRDTISAEPVGGAPAPTPTPPTPTPTPPTPTPSPSRLFSANSPFNTKVDHGRVHARSQAKVNYLTGFGALPMNLVVADNSKGDGGDSHAVCRSKASDPEYTIHQTTGWTPQMEGKKVRIPTQAKPGADGWDFHLSVIAENGQITDFWQFERTKYSESVPGPAVPRNPGGGTINCSTAGHADVGGTGLAYDGGVTQAGFAVPAGIISGEEMKAGYIPHALFMLVPGGARSGKHVPPSTGYANLNWRGETDRIEVGQRFFLDYTASQIDALAIKPWEKIIYKAFAEFGGYVGDGRGGSGFFCAFSAKSGNSYAPFGQPDPFVEYCKAQGIAPYGNAYSLRWTGGQIDWRSKLKVAA